MDTTYSLFTVIAVLTIFHCAQGQQVVVTAPDEITPGETTLTVRCAPSDPHLWKSVQTMKLYKRADNMVSNTMQQPIVSFSYNNGKDTDVTWEDQDLRQRYGVDVNGNLASDNPFLSLTIDGPNTQEKDAGSYWCGLMGTFGNGEFLYITGKKHIDVA
ncbi:uncharacterized protein LOC110458072 [Mizuhopecten yessoensis]|uniref:Ig-like domain-containing protein n=1 Tax=Mizuhopecten yessoensis TaxID=6573 RepID=A0A210Q7B8_MIZYE|nr:uncharacterized protein LOC110458072 [Mizuhopecten yessoensis]OWF44636.1 hypothetical protein KP79_PYT22073 [Mizuhopecten yessoensis]